MAKAAVAESIKAEVEVWSHKDDVEADISESCVSKESKLKQDKVDLKAVSKEEQFPDVVKVEVMPDSREEALRDNPFANLFPSLKEAAAHVEKLVAGDAEQADVEAEVLASREEALEENPFASLFPSLKEAANHLTSEKTWCKEVEKKHCSSDEQEQIIEKQDLVEVSLSMQGAELKQGSHPYLMQVEVPEVSGMKEELRLNEEKSLRKDMRGKAENSTMDQMDEVECKQRLTAVVTDATELLPDDHSMETLEVKHGAMDQLEEQNSEIMEVVENSALNQLSEVETRSRELIDEKLYKEVKVKIHAKYAEAVEKKLPRLKEVEGSSKNQFDERGPEKEEHEATVIRVDKKEVEDLDWKVLRMERRMHEVFPIMIDKRVNYSTTKVKKFSHNVEVKFIHAAKAKAVERRKFKLKMEDEVKKEQRKEPPLIIDKQDLVGVQSLSKTLPEAEAERRMDKMQGAQEQIKQALKEERLTRGEKDRHELSPLVADKLLPPDGMGGDAEAQAIVGNVKG